MKHRKRTRGPTVSHLGNDMAIRVESLSKRYRIGVAEEKHDTLTGLVTAWIKSPLENYRRLRDLTRFAENGGAQDVIWALRDVSFDVGRGEVVGIIGRNGAGKSTLLKILSHITEPSAGRAVLNGRVSSLLEVGTGFHNELTGRENVYLNGTLLGMSKGEVDAKFDEIVAFSEVEKFIDTPVKRYSSGMKVRLAFSVAAHLEPEILLIDEVLAVGDLSFQKKSLGKMESVAGGGRTVLFVSHNMAMVSSLCSRSILLRDGTVARIGDTDQVISQYQRESEATEHPTLISRNDRRGSGALRFTSLQVGADGPSDASIAPGIGVQFRLGYETLEGQTLNDVDVAVVITDVFGTPLFTCNTRFMDERFSSIPPTGTFLCSVPALPLLPGRYHIDVWAGIRGVTVDHVQRAGGLTVQERDFFGSGRLPERRIHGAILVPHTWRLGSE